MPQKQKKPKSSEKCESSIKIKETDNDQLIKLMLHCCRLFEMETVTTSQAMSIIDWLKNSPFQSLTVDEIRDAFNKSLNGKILTPKHYGKLSAKFLSDLFMDYCHKVKARQVKKENKKITAKSPKTAFNDYIKNCFYKPFNNYKKTGVWNFMGESYLYDTLEREGVIKLTNEQKWDVYNRAVEQLKEELKSGEKGMSLKSIKNVIKRINNNDKVYDNTIAVKAKKLAFREFIQNLVDYEENIEDHLKLRK